MKPFWKYLLLILLFPLFFLTHGVNENFGLIPSATIFSLLFKYLLITVGIFALSTLIIQKAVKAFVSSFLLLSVYFFFGAIKDNLPFESPYKIVLPVLLLIVLLTIWGIRKSKRDFSIASRYLTYLLVLFIAIEGFSFIKNIVQRNDQLQDFGDREHKVLGNVISDSIHSSDPDIYWLVFDMYPSSKSLKTVFNFDNPLDSFLISKGFYIAPDAISNYNYTHYSLVSSLDMSYLNEFNEGSVVTAKDLVRGNLSIKDNNVTRYLMNRGYDIQNYSIYNLDQFPSKGLASFRNNEAALIDHQTLYERVSADIGWNFIYGFKKSRHETDSIFKIKSVATLDSTYKAFLKENQKAIHDVASSKKPVFHILHVMLPHEPYIYKPDGQLQNQGYNSDPSLFIDQLKYTNRVVEELVNEIMAVQSDRKKFILLQGDHGYKFDKNDKYFQSQSCNILYAIYSTDQKYTQWYPGISGVNSFRVLLNTNFREHLPLLSDSSFHLEYRQYK